MKLYNWIMSCLNEGTTVNTTMVKEQAWKFTRCEDFIASKGWLDKFKLRFNLQIFKDSVSKESIIKENDGQASENATVLESLSTGSDFDNSESSSDLLYIDDDSEEAELI